MAVKVSYATGSPGSYEEYISSGTFVEGRIYYLIDNDGNGHILLNGLEYTIDDTGGNPADIIFENAITVTKATGNYSAGQVIPANSSLLDLITNMLAKVEITKTLPSIRIVRPTYNNTSYEIGHKLGSDFSINFNDGKYSASGFVDIPANCSASSYVVQCPLTQQTYYENIGTLLVNYQLTQTGTFIVISAYANYNAGDVPMFNGVSYPSDQIVAGTTATVSQSIQCYRACFYGYSSNDDYDFSDLSGSEIRSLGGNGQYKDIPNTISNVSALKQMFLAAPHGKYNSISIKNQDNIPQNVKGPYTKNVEGKNGFTAIEYDIWYIQDAQAAGQTQTLTITKS